MDRTTHSVELTEEEIQEIFHAMDFTAGEGQDGDNEICSSIYDKLNKALGL